MSSVPQYLRTNFRTVSPSPIEMRIPFSKAGRITIPASEDVLIYEILTVRIKEACRIEFQFRSQRSTIIRIVNSLLMDTLEMAIGSGETRISLPIFTHNGSLEDEFKVRIEGTTESNELFWEVHGGWIASTGTINIDQYPLSRDVVTFTSQVTIPVDHPPIIVPRPKQKEKAESEDENVRIDEMVETFREDKDESSER